MDRGLGRAAFAAILLGIVISGENVEGARA